MYSPLGTSTKLQSEGPLRTSENKALFSYSTLGSKAASSSSVRGRQSRHHRQSRQGGFPATIRDTRLSKSCKLFRRSFASSKKPARRPQSSCAITTTFMNCLIDRTSKPSLGQRLTRRTKPNASERLTIRISRRIRLSLFQTQRRENCTRKRSRKAARCTSATNPPSVRSSIS